MAGRRAGWVRVEHRWVNWVDTRVLLGPKWVHLGRLVCLVCLVGLGCLVFVFRRRVMLLLRIRLVLRVGLVWRLLAS